MAFRGASAAARLSIWMRRSPILTNAALFSSKAPRKTQTPTGRLDEGPGNPDTGKIPPSKQEKNPLEPFANNTNPYTGEVGGPRGPEPTRYGDWERKGRVTDF